MEAPGKIPLLFDIWKSFGFCLIGIFLISPSKRSDVTISYFRILSASGLTLIALGTGGMKPCIAAFGAEQFKLPDQKDMLSNFFSFFYSTINLGGFLGMILIPLLKKNFSCFGQDTCYAVGFGVPVLLLIVTLGK